MNNLFFSLLYECDNVSAGFEHRVTFIALVSDCAYCEAIGWVVRKVMERKLKVVTDCYVMKIEMVMVMMAIVMVTGEDGCVKER